MQPNAEVAAYRTRISKLEETKTVGTRVVRYFPNTHLGNGHDGLALIAKENGVHIKNLKWGEYVIFTNKKLTALKLYSQGGLVAHLKVPGKLDLKTVALIPRFFNGQEINYLGALTEALKRTTNH